MALSTARKAALFLKGLDPATAGELLKPARPETVTEIAAELAYLGAGSGEQAGDSAKSVREFFSLLGQTETDRGGDEFLQELLENAMGKDRSQEVLLRVQQLVEGRTPFVKIRSAAVEDIAKALAGESAQVAALVLSELPAAKSSQLLALLGEEVQGEAISSMASADRTAPDTRLRVAEVVQKRLDELARVEVEQPEAAAPEEDRRQQQHRKVAVLVRGLKKESRDGLMASLSEKDAPAGESVQRLMVIWEDLPIVSDRALQDVLRQADAKQLALALAGADRAAIEKVRNNISDRASAMLDEEISLMSSPKPEEIDAAREEILAILREVNAKGELTFEES